MIASVPCWFAVSTLRSRRRGRLRRTPIWIERAKSAVAPKDRRRAVVDRVIFAVPGHGVGAVFRDGAPFIVADLASLARRAAKTQRCSERRRGQDRFFGNADFH